MFNHDLFEVTGFWGKHSCDMPLSSPHIRVFVNPHDVPGDVIMMNLVNVVSARCLHCKVTAFPVHGLILWKQVGKSSLLSRDGVLNITSRRGCISA